MDTDLFIKRGNSRKEPSAGGQIMSLTWKSVDNHFLYKSGAQGDGSDPTGGEGGARREGGKCGGEVGGVEAQF